MITSDEFEKEPTAKGSAIVSFSVDISDPCGTVRLPESVKGKCLWSVLRHAVLLNAYWAWVNSGAGTKEDFSNYLIQAINKGLYPMLEKNESDSNQEPFTAYSIKSQLDWMAQPENCVIVIRNGKKEFYPNNLLAMTSFQKQKEALASKLRKESNDSNDPEDDKLLSALVKVLSDKNVLNSIKELVS